MTSNPDLHDIRVLNAALLEVVDFVQAEGWDRPATLFGLVPHALVADALGSSFDDDANNPLALVVQEDVPDHIRPGSEELGEFIATVRWPEQVVGAILAQEITFVNSAEGAGAEPHAARLYSGVLNEDGSGAERSLIQLRPTDQEMSEDAFAQDKVELLGGDDIAPGVIATLRATFEEGFDDE
ncbi:PPA1309 family protein [Corynebacterium dentalis]|uniref:PPA1309 family protein n=1 Tax=Corynebacterium dentalis TaxID=2014528 RepID=UPI00370D5921